MTNAHETTCKAGLPQSNMGLGMGWSGNNLGFGVNDGARVRENESRKTSTDGKCGEIFPWRD